MNGGMLPNISRKLLRRVAGLDIDTHFGGVSGDVRFFSLDMLWQDIVFSERESVSF